MIDYAADWRAAGACLSADPDLFFPIATTGSSAGRQITEARRVCAGCQVRQKCLDFAMRNGETHGIWGGTTPEERVSARQQRLRRHGARTSWQQAPGARAS
jgi:WhiB family transcriptional regulator, redox-sensing transcriptional regulator